MMIPGIVAQRRLGGGAWSPAELFTLGELGCWYDVSDLSSMWQDSAGTIAAEVDSPVGRLNDKSGKGNHLTQASGFNRPILRSSGGKHWLEFSGSHILRGSSLSAFNFFHAGNAPAHLHAACRFGAVADPNAVYGLCGNNGSATASIGFFVFHDTRDGVRDDESVFRSTRGVVIYDVDPPADTVPANANLALSVSLEHPGAAQARMFVDGAVVHTSSRTSTGTALNATYALDVGSSGNAIFPLNGRLYQLVIVNRLPTVTERAALDAFMAGKI